MSQYQPQQPGPHPHAPKKNNTGKIIGIGCGGIFALLVIIGIFGAALGSGSNDTTSSSAATTDNTPKTNDKTETTPTKEPAAEAEEEPAKSQADQFKDCVAKNGTPTEKTAVKHVTKVTGADKQNNILDSAEVYTDFTGGIVGPHQGEAKLIAAAFASCYESENGLVTVYGEDGEMISNGKF